MPQRSHNRTRLLAEAEYCELCAEREDWLADATDDPAEDAYCREMAAALRAEAAGLRRTERCGDMGADNKAGSPPPKPSFLLMTDATKGPAYG